MVLNMISDNLALWYCIGRDDQNRDSIVAGLPRAYSVNCVRLSDAGYCEKFLPMLP